MAASVVVGVVVTLLWFDGRQKRVTTTTLAVSELLLGGASAWLPFALCDVATSRLLPGFRHGGLYVGHTPRLIVRFDVKLS